MRPDQKSSLFLIVDIYLLYSTMFSSHYLLSEVFLTVQALFIVMDVIFYSRLVRRPQKSRYN